MDWRPWLGEGLAAAARAMAWAVWDPFAAVLAERRGDLRTTLSTSGLGSAIALTARDEGRAQGFEAARAALPRLARLQGLAGTDAYVRDYPLAGFVSGLAADCRDPGLLWDVAGLLTAELAPVAPRQAELLRALARIDEAADPQTVFARMDPDLALSLRRIRDLPEPQAKTPRRRPKRG